MTEASSIDITWELVSNAKSWPHLKPIKSRTVY